MIAVNFEEKFVKEEEKKLEKIKDKNWISEVVAKEKVPNQKKIYKKLKKNYHSLINPSQNWLN